MTQEVKLGEAISLETKAPLDSVLLLRHSNSHVARLRSHGATVEEYTALQPKLSLRYDFWHPERTKIRVVCVIVDDRVYGVFEVTGALAEGSSRIICTPEYGRYDATNPERDCRLYELRLLPSKTVGQGVSGWLGRERMPVQRHDGGFFNEVSIQADFAVLMQKAVEEHYEIKLKASIDSTSEERRKRLANAPKLPTSREVLTVVYDRNTDVVAEVLERAAGSCEICKRPAPFQRRKDSTPYLEVHHVVQLADGGEDTAANAVAACPNCHRGAHYG